MHPLLKFLKFDSPIHSLREVTGSHTSLLHNMFVSLESCEALKSTKLNLHLQGLGFVLLPNKNPSLPAGKKLEVISVLLYEW